MQGQMSLFEPDFIKDSDCTVDTPVKRGKKDLPIYGSGKRIKPRLPGRQDTEHQKELYLEELLPLEEYDLIVVLISGGKDSIACYFKLRELGVPKNKIEFWHHDIDGGNPKRHMDWRCTQNYMKALAEAEGIPLRLSWRVDGFFGEGFKIVRRHALCEFVYLVGAMQELFVACHTGAKVIRHSRRAFQ